ncbi:MAG: hypothetical protein K6T83_14735 [Alicyclobacillus sp.]|nr:hypothetical protein [Alicyclobacillus sp.]
MSSKAPDGLVLGPWSADSQSLFYWPDPDHSASILADGTELIQQPLHGKAKQIAVTLTGNNAVIPTVGAQAVIQVGAGRFMNEDKSIEVWTGSRLKVFSHPKNTVEYAPSVSPDNKQVLFVQAPVSNLAETGERYYRQWQAHQQLIVQNLSSGRQRTLLHLTDGNQFIRQFMFGPSCQQIVVCEATKLIRIDADGTGAPVTIVTTSGGLRVLDYVSSPLGPN